MMETNIPRNPDGSPRVITFLYAFIVQSKDGEGIPAMQSTTPMGMPLAMPLIASDHVRVESIRGAAQQCANDTGCDVTLVKFVNRQEVETIKPQMDAKYGKQNYGTDQR